MTEPRFRVAIISSDTLTIRQLWPDDNAPEKPTVDDVLQLIRDDGGPDRVLRDWNLSVRVEVDMVGHFPAGETDHEI